MTQDITRDVAHLLFVVDVNPVVLNMHVHVLNVITADAFVCHRGELHPMSYSISHHLYNCSLISTIYWLPRYTCQWH